MKRKKYRPSQDRLDVLARIEENERTGGESFFADTENDPPVKPLLPGEVDYLCVKPRSRIFRTAARAAEAVCSAWAQRKFGIRVQGEENIRALRGGAVITSNHFSEYENLAVRRAAGLAGGGRRMYKVVREGNYSMQGFIGFMLRHADTLPLSGNIHVMQEFEKAVSGILNRGDFILVYPEQSMWWNYRKPRPYRTGAFYLAAKNKVPVIPMFVTLEGSGRIGENGFEDMLYTVHIMKPVYPAEGETVRAAASRMMAENTALCREKYREIYGEAPSYLCGDIYGA